MFATEDDYTEAVKGSQIHTYENETQKKSIIINLIVLITLTLLVYFAFKHYKKSDITLSNNHIITQKSVLGVSHTAYDTKERVKEDDYLSALENMEVDTLDSNNASVDIREAMSSIVESSVTNDSDYAQNISKEIRETKHIQNRVIIVQEGDTLASLSEKYYGSELNYKKIMASNSNISSESGIIYVGQKIVLPF